MKKRFNRIIEYIKFIFLVSIFWVVISLTGINNAIINWTFLLLVFGTTIGGNFFDKNLVNKRFLEDIEEENLILRKISFYIGVVFLYIGILIPDTVINSPFYFSITGELPSNIKYLVEIFLKSCISVIVFATYWGTQNQILYQIFKFYYRDKDKELKCRSKLAKVVLEEEKWKVVEKDIQQDIPNLKRISIDTYQIKEDKRDTDCVAQKSERSEKNKKDNRHTYYVAQKSEILDKIEGLPKTAGYSILGVIDSFTVIFAILTISILPGMFFLNHRVEVNNGTYYIYRNLDNIDSSDTIEISDDTIIYNGKAETFDKRKQSFSMGKIKKNDGNNITITFYKNGEKVPYTKVNSSGIPYELKEKYKSIFSSGSSDFIFNKNENEVTQIESQTRPFLVIPEDKLDGKAKDVFNKHKSEYGGNYFIFTLNTKYDKDSSNIYVAILSDGGKEIKINKLDSSSKDDNYFSNFTGKAE